MLVDRARRGGTIVRLKGGDPFIFGRGGEEIEALAAAGIPFEIVPGVTTPLGIAAYTGVPLTHREHTSAVTFVTGHNVDAIDWSKVGASETIVLFMGLVNFPEIARELIARGRSAETPAMAVRWATRPDQQTITGTLASLPAGIAAARLKPPATIVIGEVVALREKFNWFERLPLFGKRVIITRDRRQAMELAEPLEALGAETILLPVIEVRAVDPSLRGSWANALMLEEATRNAKERGALRFRFFASDKLKETLSLARRANAEQIRIELQYARPVK